jgi:wyosine [tRNA(Phe)-imidazoG37] synthetase (radical SAM superfamily)
MKTLFGPVPSRRLGRSLGIDVVPPKTCSYDCIYCESGRTTHLTLKRRVFVQPEDVLEELERYFRSHPDGAEALTFSSAGEPTLYEGLGALIRAIKKRFNNLPLNVLTNGSLLWDPQVRRELLHADRVVPSLDAITPDHFQKVNRPHPNLDLSLILEGLLAFRREYRGQFHLEVMLVAQVNDQDEHLTAINTFVTSLRPDRVELNTVVRPPADPGVCGLTPQAMKQAARFFPEDTIEIPGCFASAARIGHAGDLAERIQELLRRRPCTAGEMTDCLAVPVAQVQAALDTLQRSEVIHPQVFGNREYYCLFTRNAS